MKFSKEFPIAIYGTIKKYNDILSKARCRIFYKYENRNGTYITDEFAEKLLASLPYVPVKGIYESDDFTDHGDARDEGRIYGIVPENPNVQWEKHLDEDGVEREYACADVLIFSALYSEANEIVGKAQSMELYEPSIKFHMALKNGQRYVVFDEGCFLGLQALGDDVEPCFEGASFYTLQKSIEDTISKIKEFSKGGIHQMQKINFKLSDSQKADAIWALINPDCNEEGGWVCNCALCQIYDDYALIYDYVEDTYKRAYYKKDDETDTVEILSYEVVYVVDITATEKENLDKLRELNGGNYSQISENLTNADSNAEKIQEYVSQNEELNSTISTLNTEVAETKSQIETLTADYTAAQESISSLNVEVEELRNYKLGIETQQKEAVLSEYEDKISDEILATYKEKLGSYTVLGLDKELAYELKKANATAFTNNVNGFIPKEQPTGGIEEILSKYKK